MTVIDESALEMLRELSPEDPDAFVKKIVEVFLKQSNQDIGEMQNALLAGKVSEVMNLSHKMKSGARSVGALMLGDLSEGVEKAAKGNVSAADLKAPVDALIQAFKKAEAELLKKVGL